MLVRAISASGGDGSETELWTRAVSSMPSGTTASLGQNFTNFDMLRIYFYKSTSATSREYVEEIDTSTLAMSNTKYIIGNGGYARYVYKGSSDDTVVFDSAIQHYHIATDNSQVIPFKICGIKY